MKRTVTFMNMPLAMGVKEKVQLEKSLGQSPLNFIFGMVGNMNGEELDLSSMKIPPLPVMVEILFFASIKLNHGITREKFMDMLDTYLEQEDEHSVMDLFGVVMEVLQVAKYLPSVKEEE